MNEPRPRTFLTHIKIGLAIWLVTSVPTVGGVIFGWQLVRPNTTRADSMAAAFAKWDGEKYASIVDRGYYYNPNDQSNIAFFPAFPFVAKLLMSITGVESRLALLLVAQFFLAASFVALHAYARLRFPERPESFASSVVLVAALFPSTFFFRMAYSESLFVFLIILTLLCVQIRASLIVMALIVGCTTATRSVGVALVPVVVLEIWRRSASGGQFALRSLALLPLSCWGLAAFVLWQGLVLGEPLAFAYTQKSWSAYPNTPWSEKIVSLLMLEPIGGSVLPSSRHFSTYDAAWGIGALSLSALNAFFFVVGAALVAMGGWRRILTRQECLASAGLLLIPYVLRGYDSYFMSFARFASVVAPMYLPLTLAVVRLPRLAQTSLVIMATAVMILACALFAAGYYLT